jgi:hypothetical protein
VVVGYYYLLVICACNDELAERHGSTFGAVDIGDCPLEGLVEQLVHILYAEVSSYTTLDSILAKHSVHAIVERLEDLTLIFLRIFGHDLVDDQLKDGVAEIALDRLVLAHLLNNFFDLLVGYVMLDILLDPLVLQTFLGGGSIVGNKGHQPFNEVFRFI